MDEIKKIAFDELEAERKRVAIDEMKRRLKEKSFWSKIIPWTIRIERRK